MRLLAIHLAKNLQTSPIDVLVAEGWLDERALLLARSKCFSATHVRLSQTPPDKSLIAEFGLSRCLQLGLLPWRRLGGRVVWVTSRPETFHDITPDLPAQWGTPIVSVAFAEDIDQALAGMFAKELIGTAESGISAEASCRNWARPRSLHVLLGLACGFLALCAVPHVVWAATLLCALAVVAVNVVFKSLLTFAALRSPAAPPAPRAASIRLPRFSVLVPLLREAEVAGKLLNNLERLQYPRALLDVLFIVETGDDVTKTALSQHALPQSFRVIEVPAGTLQTKPRALNYALHFCRGDVIGIFDAEDKPEPQQLLKVAEASRTSPESVGCLQGRLDFFNTGHNWITRCFTAEYAGWFGLQLPGLARLGLPVPLGGTTLFIKRTILDEVGGWDAHNVTEDADLGLRLHRAGYRTALVDTVTDEEATSHVWPWIRQRSRWIKGYIVTYAVHMRRPRALLRDVGPAGFAAVQCLFLGSILGVLTMPFLLILLAAWLGMNVPGLSDDVLRLFGSVLLGFEGLNLTVWAVGLRARRHRHLWWCLPLLHLYFLMSSVAALKAVWELMTRPFFWDKTSHGITDAPARL